MNLMFIVNNRIIINIASTKDNITLGITDIPDQMFLFEKGLLRSKRFVMKLFFYHPPGHFVSILKNYK